VSGSYTGKEGRHANRTAFDYPDFLANWMQTFHGWNAANIGWGGDTVQNLLWRLRNGFGVTAHPIEVED